jgi:arylsulfatase A-like enzyme
VAEARAGSVDCAASLGGSLLRRILDSPWTWFALAGALLVAAVSYVVDVRLPARSVADAGEIAGLRARDDLSVVFVLIDTLRADRLGAYGYSKATTPFLDSLAKDGVLFEQHMANSNNTLSSHASILTGLVPLAHGTKDGGSDATRFALADGVETLAERMADAGYTTASFTAHPAWLARGFGLDQGFEHLESEWWSAPQLGQAFLRWLDAEAPTNVFAFLHFYDVHSDMAGEGVSLPYQADAEFVERFAGPRPADFTGTVPGKDYQCCSRWLEAANKGEFALAPAHVDYVSGLYDAGLAQLDRDLARLFRELHRRGYLDGAWIVVTSDHGEEFQEHGKFMHGGFHDEVARVPLIVVPPPGTVVARRTVSAVTRSIDLSATLADLAGAPGLGSGRSLRSAFVEGAPLADGEVMFLESVLRARDERGPFRILDDARRVHLWDLLDDPAERTDLMEHAPGEATVQRAESARAHLALLRRAAQEHAARVRASSATGAAALSAEEEARLRSLGYGGR